MAITIMNVAEIIGGRVRAAEIARRIVARRFTWNPGMRPVRVPANKPRKIAIMISRII